MNDINVDEGTILEALNNKVDLPTNPERAQDQIDYVVDWQVPTEENSYTWYRKYKSGWVEQGGYYTGGNQNKILPIKMADTTYHCLTACSEMGNVNWHGNPITCIIVSTTKISLRTYGDYTNCSGWWKVEGQAA